MSCSCSSCKPSCQSENAADCPYESSSGQLVVRDDNCSERRLMGSDGIVSVNGDSFASVTDGSQKRGLILINPDEASAFDHVIGISNGVMTKLGESSEDLAVLQKVNGKILFKTLPAQSTYKLSELRSGAANLASFVCGTGGKASLGKLSTIPDTILGFDSSGNPLFVPYKDLAKSLLAPICSEVIAVPDSETIAGTLVCTENGLRKNSAPSQLINHQTPWHVVGDWANTAGAGVLPNPNQVLYSFTPSTLPGYSESYNTMWLRILLKFGTLGQDVEAIFKTGGQIIFNGRIGEDGTNDPAADYINPTYVIPFPIGNPNLPIVTEMILTYISDVVAPGQGGLYIGHSTTLIGWSQ